MDFVGFAKRDVMNNVFRFFGPEDFDNFKQLSKIFYRIRNSKIKSLSFNSKTVHCVKTTVVCNKLELCSGLNNISFQSNVYPCETVISSLPKPKLLLGISLFSEPPESFLYGYQKTPKKLITSF